MSSVAHSDSIAELSKALILFHQKCPKIPKASRNPFLKSKYADLSTILDIVQPVLNECELVVSQHPTPDYGLTTIISHSSGEWMRSEYKMQPLESVVEKGRGDSPAVKAVTPQSIGVIITYQRRYALGAILALNIDDDNDGQQDTGAASSGKETKPAAPQKSVKELMEEAAAKTNGAKVDDPAKSETKTESNQGGEQPDGDSTAEQRAMLKELFEKLNITPEQQSTILAKRGLQVIRSLSFVQASEIIDALKAKLPSLADDDKGQSLEDRHAAANNEPCSDQQVSDIKAAVSEWEQHQPGVTATFVAKLNGAGFPKIASLTFDQARSLLADIEMRNIENFFGSIGQTAKAG